MRIYHDSRNISYRKPFGAAPVGSRIILNADVSECELESVKLELWQDGCGHELIPMKETEHGRFSAEITAQEEAEMFRRFKAGEKGYKVAMETGININAVYYRFTKWRDNDVL